MKFVGMKSIPKLDRYGSERWKDWVATEKVHGSSYQFFTDDGVTVGSASRRHVLNETGSFLKCPVKEFRERHQEMVKKVYQKIINEDRWAPYREENRETNNDDDDDDEGGEEEKEQGEYDEVSTNASPDSTTSLAVVTNGEDDGDATTTSETFTVKTKTKDANDGDDNVAQDGGIRREEIVAAESSVYNDERLKERLSPKIDEEQETKKDNGVSDDDGVSKVEKENIVDGGEGRMKANEDENNADIDQRRNETVELRIYGELYGGGGVEKDKKTAVQKEIIYCDEFRFYVFAISVNRRWLSLSEMNEMCEHAGFLYYAKPVSEPKSTVEELKAYLLESGFMRSRSQLTEKNDNDKTFIEGVVMSPLTRPGYGLHAIKFLAPAFNDVRMVGNAKKELKPNYCTKARYHSVISKLDIPERENAMLVTGMFIADILKESGETDLSSNKTKAYTKCVRLWLSQDGYVEPDERAVMAQEQKTRGKKGKTARGEGQRKMNDGKEEVKGETGQVHEKNEKFQRTEQESFQDKVENVDEEDGFMIGLFE